MHMLPQVPKKRSAGVGASRSLRHLGIPGRLVSAVYQYQVLSVL